MTSSSIWVVIVLPVDGDGDSADGSTSRQQIRLVCLSQELLAQPDQHGRVTCQRQLPLRRPQVNPSGRLPFFYSGQEDPVILAPPLDRLGRYSADVGDVLVGAADRREPLDLVKR